MDEVTALMSNLRSKVSTLTEQVHDVELELDNSRKVREAQRQLGVIPATIERCLLHAIIDELDLTFQQRTELKEVAVSFLRLSLDVPSRHLAFLDGRIMMQVNSRFRTRCRNHIPKKLRTVNQQLRDSTHNPAMALPDQDDLNELCSVAHPTLKVQDVEALHMLATTLVSSEGCSES
eukprot:TRINITY_DN74829_c0_g1_i1.p1 TRINITY_DN74829_c0_g1~~TRINITY_DN74829_c0_g1_i1.p1  ORF type:complete len:177 (-),score=13.24 TRINITY_DN74829_c0_g1_i1:39-569(-)